MNWYYQIDQATCGPISFQELKELVNNNVVRRTDLIGTDDMVTWVEAQEIEGLFPSKIKYIFIIMAIVIILLMVIVGSIIVFKQNQQYEYERLKKIEEQKQKNLREEYERQRRLEEQREREERREKEEMELARLEKQKLEQERLAQEEIKIQKEKEEMERIAKEEQERIKQEQERIKRLAEEKEARRLANLSIDDMNEIISLIRSDNQSRKIALQAVARIGPDAKKALPAILNSLKNASNFSLALYEADLAIQAIGKESIPEVLYLFNDLPKDKKLNLVGLLLKLDNKNQKIIETVLPLLLTELNTDAVSNYLIKIGQPSVDAIFAKIKTMEYRGKENILYRKKLFNTIILLGPTCKSKYNYETMKFLRERENQEMYTDVQEAAWKALNSMKP